MAHRGMPPVMAGVARDQQALIKERPPTASLFAVWLSPATANQCVSTLGSERCNGRGKCLGHLLHARKPWQRLRFELRMELGIRVASFLRQLRVVALALFRIRQHCVRGVDHPYQPRKVLTGVGRAILESLEDRAVGRLDAVGLCTGCNLEIIVVRVIHGPLPLNR